MCKGNSGSSSSSSSIDPTVKANYQNVVGTAQSAAATPYQPYQGQQVAGFSQDQQTAMQNIDALQGTATPYLNTASQYAALGAAPIAQNLPQYNAQTLQQYQSPYTQQVVNATQNQINQNNAVQQSQLAGQAIQSGASPFGGDRAGVAAAALAGQQDLAGQQTISNLYNQGFQNAQTQLGTQQNLQLQAGNADAARAGAAANTFGQLGVAALGSNLTAAQAQLQSGTLQQQQSQSQLNVPYQNYLNSQLYPFQTTGWLSNIVEGLGNQGGSTQSTPAQPSVGSQVAGGAATTIGLLGATGAFSSGSGGSGWLSGLFSKDGGAISQDRVREAMQSGGLGAMQDRALADQRNGNVYHLSGLSGIPGLEPMASGGRPTGLGALTHFAEGGGPGSGSHDSNHDGGGDSDGGGGGNVSGGGGRGSTGTTAGGQSSPEGGFGGGQRGSPAGRSGTGPAGGGGGTGTTASGGPSSPEGGFGGGERGSPAGAGSMGPAGGGPSMSPEGLSALGPMSAPNVSIGPVTHNVDPSSPPGETGPGEVPGSTDDPTSWGGLVSQALHNIMNPTPAVRGLGVAMSALPSPIGVAATTAIGLGTAMGTKDAATIAGVRNGTISGTISKDANGQDVAHVGGSNYGGTATGTRGGTGTASGGMGSGPDSGGAGLQGIGSSGGLPASAVTGTSPTGLGTVPPVPILPSPTAEQTLAGTSSVPHGVIPFTFNNAPGYPGVQIPTMGQFPSNNYADGGVPHFADGGWGDMNLGQFLDPSTSDPELDSSPQMDLTGSTVGVRYPSEDEALDTGLPPPAPAAAAKAAPEQSGNWVDRAASSPWMALTDVGLGILGSGSPFLGQAIGQGAQAGLQTYQNQKSQAIDNAYRQQLGKSAAAEAAMKNMQVAGYQRLQDYFNNQGAAAPVKGVGQGMVAAQGIDNSSGLGVAPQDATSTPNVSLGDTGLGASAVQTAGAPGLGAVTQQMLQPETKDTGVPQQPVDASTTQTPPPAVVAGQSGQAAPMIDPGRLWKLAQVTAGVPGMEQMSTQYMTEALKGVPEGMYLGNDGALYMRPGLTTAKAQEALAGKGMIQDPNGGWHYPTGYVQAEAGLEGAKTAASTNAKNVSDLKFEPLIQGGVRNAQNASDLNYKPAIEGAVAQAQVAPHVAEDVLKTHTYHPGDVVTQNGQVVANVPQLVEGTDTSGTPQKTWQTTPVAITPPTQAGGTGASVANPAAPAPIQSGLNPARKQIQEDNAKDFNTVKTNAESAQQVLQRLPIMDHAIDDLNKSGLTSTGTGAQARLSFAKAFNSLETTVGLTPSFDPQKIASWEDLNKESTRMGFELAKSLGSREAAMIVNSAIQAVPNAENTAAGAKLVSSSLRQAAQRQVDMYQFQSNWADQHAGQTQGADIAFNKQNPPDMYAKKAVSAIIPPAAAALLKQHPDLKGQFDAKYGEGMADFMMGQ